MKVKNLKLTPKGEQTLKNIAEEFYTTVEILGEIDIPVSPSDINSDIQRRLVDLAVLWCVRHE